MEIPNGLVNSEIKTKINPKQKLNTTEEDFYCNLLSRASNFPAHNRVHYSSTVMNEMHTARPIYYQLISM